MTASVIKDGRTGLPLNRNAILNPNHEQAAIQLAKTIALDEGYTWQLHPNAAQLRKQDKLMGRARRYIDMVLERLG